MPGTAQENNAPAGTGDFADGPANSPAAMKWVQLSAGAAGVLNPVVHNAAGFTLYRFDKDTTKPSKSNCNDACATTWPPVLVQPGSRIFLDGVSRADIGVVKRDDGALQITIGGWPVYRFKNDTAPGQANGQGVGGTWFAVTPEGGKAGQSPQGTDTNTQLDYQNGTAKRHDAPPNTGDMYNGPRNSPEAMKWVQLTAGSAGGLSPIVHDGAGFTPGRAVKAGREDPCHPNQPGHRRLCALRPVLGDLAPARRSRDVGRWDQRTPPAGAASPRGARHRPELLVRDGPLRPALRHRLLHRRHHLGHLCPGGTGRRPGAGRARAAAHPRSAQRRAAPA
ncbi:hypothetical protein GCM10010430_55770 [Kitasatospora cystarginea]|uniref:Lipoprotein n=1 Tax=Kitasatospora cystarginea TaxID=58350 RepID=A0ABN3EN82_9ACTN